MGSASGIELGPASCVLVNARAGVAGTEVSAVRVVDPVEWPAHVPGVIALLKAARKAKKLPRRARVVAWELQKPAPLSDPGVRALIKPVVAAGFAVDAVLTPAEALAAVSTARKRPNEGPIAWLSVNTHGAAIAIVKGSQVLFSKTLAWPYQATADTVKGQLLQRYSLVAHIGPHLKHGIQRVQEAHGGKVETVVTCGDLPDLRSLTMPLIEEMDIEVETLDTPDGLIGRGDVETERLAERAPAIRLACAAAVAPVARKGLRLPPWLAAGMLLAVVGVAAYVLVDPSTIVPVDARLAAEPEPAKPVAKPAAPVQESASAPASAPVAPTPVQTPEPRPDLAPAPRPAPARPTAGIVPPEKKGGQPLPPVPPVTSILIDSGRRLAMIGGEIVGVGDSVGPRVVVRIEATSVVLREPSGAEITVLLRPAGASAVKLLPFAEQDRR